jgi:aminopeptidase C
MTTLLGGGLWQLVLGLLAAVGVLGGWVLKQRAEARASRALGMLDAERQRTRAAEARAASAAARAEAQAVAAGRSDAEIDADLEAMARLARGEPPAGKVSP